MESKDRSVECQCGYKCKACRAKYHREYRKRTRKARQKYRKAYYKANAYKWTEYSRNRRETDVLFRLLVNLRGRIWHALNRNPKSDHTIELLGCSPAGLRTHLESQFKEGMSWDNYGEWHVDHKRPCDSFDLSDPEQQRLCFHYMNLQPLWAPENRAKSNKY